MMFQGLGHGVKPRRGREKRRRVKVNRAGLVLRKGLKGLRPPCMCVKYSLSVIKLTNYLLGCQ